MDQGMRLLVYPVKDIAKAKAFYRELLGVEPYASVDLPSAGAFSFAQGAGTAGPVSEG